MIGLSRRFLGSVANKEVRRSGAGSRGSGRERTKRWARLHGGEHGARIAWKYTACQFIFGVSFEWSRKTLKCLEVTSLQVEVQEWGTGAGKRKNLTKEGAESRWRK